MYIPSKNALSWSGIKFNCLKLIYLISNYRKSFYVKKNEAILQIKIYSLVIY